MCAQCAFVALAAIGTYSAFHNQIRARVDKALGFDDAEIGSIVSDNSATDATPEPLTPERSITFAVFLLALSQLRHRPDPTPAVAAPPAAETRLATGLSTAGD